LWKNLGKFDWWLPKNVAEKLIDYLEDWEGIKCVWENLDKFEWLDKEIAEKLIGSWFDEALAKNLDKFEWLDKEIAEKLIKGSYREYVVAYPEKFWLEKED
jgi:hypothetical protein